jgi:transposase-like protein
MESLILGPDGKEVRSSKYDPCPKCGASYEHKIPSGSFGKAHMICGKCGHEFKEIPCVRATL